MEPSDGQHRAISSSLEIHVQGGKTLDPEKFQGKDDNWLIATYPAKFQ
jgi:hypothetical protein